jgi:hypothetical protein
MALVTELLLNWHYAVLPTLAYCAVGFLGTRRLERTLDALGGAIRSRADLAALRGAINLNMALALSLLALYGAYFVTLLFLLFTGRLSLPVFVVFNCFLPLAGKLCSAAYYERVEARARSLAVAHPDPEIEATYLRWIKQWREPRLRLS